MSCRTPTRPLESSAKRLLKRVNMCTERSFERTPIRYATSKRKTLQTLSSTLTSAITLLSIADETLVGDHTLTNSTFLSLNRTLTENSCQKSIFNDTTMTTPWEVIDSVNSSSSSSHFSVITMNQSDVSQATVISRRSRKASSIRPSSLLTRLLKPSTPKSVTTSVKFMNRCVRDIDRLSDTFGQEWITLPNFV